MWRPSDPDCRWRHPASWRRKRSWCRNRFRTRTGRYGPGDYTSWQILFAVGEWDEFGIVAGNSAEGAVLPFLLGAFDAGLVAGNEIPPDMARAIQWRTAQQHDAGRCFSIKCYVIVRFQRQEGAGTVGLDIAGLHFAFNYKEGTLFMIGRVMQRTGGVEAGIGIE